LSKDKAQRKRKKKGNLCHGKAQCEDRAAGLLLEYLGENNDAELGTAKEEKPCVVRDLAAGEGFSKRRLWAPQEKQVRKMNKKTLYVLPLSVTGSKGST